VRVLIACEFSGIVRDAFARRGHDAWSCDLLANERDGQHIQGDVLGIIGDGWDLMIAHPPCTYLAVSGARWFAGRQREQAAALGFVRALLDAPVARIALENPISIISTRIRKPDQIVQPWQFGDDASKATCLWIKGLPRLLPTNILPGGKGARRANQTPSGQNRLGPSPRRAVERARTYPGIASAMADQWGGHHDHHHATP
jgi:hypothetical protein